MSKTSLVFSVAVGLLLLSPRAHAQGDQPLPTPPGPGSAPTATPPTAPAQGDDPGAVVPPPPPPPTKKVVKRAAPVEDSPVVRGNGNWAFLWRFGGLASLNHQGNARQIVDGLAMTHVGVKYAPSETWMFPVYIGAALGVRNPPGDGDAETSLGLELGGGVEYHFRIWRRISPYIGGAAGLFYTNPTGDDSYDIGIGLGPVLGVEYYIGDRLSLQAQYTLVVAMAFETRPSTPEKSTRTSFGVLTSVGGALNITYYF